MKPDQQLNLFGIRSFRETADKDYICARLAYKAELLPQFFWQSLHCLEKYTKAILLFNRVSSKGIKHEVLVALKRLQKERNIEIKLSEQTLTFIERLEEFAHFRYLEVSWASHGHDIVRLDRAVWELRRYCTPLNQKITTITGKNLNLFEDNLKRLQAMEVPTNRNWRIHGGLLERILSKPNHPSREGLVWKNLIFTNSNRKKIELFALYHTENAPLFVHPELLEEVQKYVFLPKEVVNAYKRKK